MDDPGPYELAGRLAVAAAVTIAPTLCFLGLLRGLERLRDDDLIAEWARRHGAKRDVRTEDEVLTALAGEMGVDTEGGSSVRCPVCGTANRPGVTFCRGCQNRLGSS
ncbi:zinc ribbon domain-containing protein [Natrinema sp. H-ect1]|uniref:DUF7577 domain-containing protein n=1 Tax=Natrinema sp. H-ect1 TaxID=3242700 RepID=UPI00359F0173